MCVSCLCVDDAPHRNKSSEDGVAQDQVECMMGAELCHLRPRVFTAVQAHEAMCSSARFYVQHGLRVENVPPKGDGRLWKRPRDTPG